MTLPSEAASVGPPSPVAARGGTASERASGAA